MMLAILGLHFMSGIWPIITIIIGIIGLFAIGFFYDKHKDSGLLSVEAAVVISGAVFWPIVLLIAIGIGIFAIPILSGKYTKKYLKNRKDKDNFVNEIYKIQKSRT